MMRGSATRPGRAVSIMDWRGFDDAARASASWATMAGTRVKTEAPTARPLDERGIGEMFRRIGKRKSDGEKRHQI
jgi:hypothetical protein